MTLWRHAIPLDIAKVRLRGLQAFAGQPHDARFDDDAPLPVARVAVPSCEHMADRGAAAEARSAEAVPATSSLPLETPSSARHGAQDVLQISLPSWRAPCTEPAELGLEIVFRRHLRASSPILLD
jgi:hypothetical protein